MRRKRGDNFQTAERRAHQRSSPAQRASRGERAHANPGRPMIRVISLRGGALRLPKIRHLRSRAADHGARQPHSKRDGNPGFQPSDAGERGRWISKRQNQLLRARHNFGRQFHGTAMDLAIRPQRPFADRLAVGFDATGKAGALADTTQSEMTKDAGTAAVAASRTGS